MARKPEPIAEAPSLPPTSVDFNAFHDAIAAGKTGEEAIAKADLTPAAPAPEADEPAQESPESD